MSKATPKSAAKARKETALRVREYYRRMREEGWRRMSVWIPPGGKEDFDTAVDELYEKWGVGSAPKAKDKKS